MRYFVPGKGTHPGFRLLPEQVCWVSAGTNRQNRGNSSCLVEDRSCRAPRLCCQCRLAPAKRPRPATRILPTLGRSGRCYRHRERSRHLLTPEVFSHAHAGHRRLSPGVRSSVRTPYRLVRPPTTVSPLLLPAFPTTGLYLHVFVHHQRTTE